MLFNDLLHIKYLLQGEVSLCTCTDLPFLQGLLEIIPSASDDLAARNALWNIVARLLVKVREDEISLSSLHQYVSILVSTSDMIEDDLLDHQLDDYIREDNHSSPCTLNASARMTAVSFSFELV